MQRSMWQSVRVAPKTSQLEKRSLPEIGPKDVLIGVKLCGVCASEVHPWLSEGEPQAFGHEVVGEVVEVGAGVAGLEPPMRVTGLIHKGFAEYAAAPAKLLLPVPETLPDEAALGEPLACVISGMRRTAIDLGDRVALVGLGFMGLLTLQAARLKGPAELIAIDTREEARGRALSYGADRVLEPSAVPPDLLLEAWEDIPKGYGVNVAIEAAGNPHALALAGRMAKEHGVLAIVGYHQGEPVPVNMKLWNWKALSVLNAHERRKDYQMDCMRRGLALLEKGKLDVASLVTHSFSLEHVDDAYSAILDKPSAFVKSIIRVSA